MSLIRLTPPAVDPVTLADVKDHLRVDFDDEDARIAGYIGSAVQCLDGRDGLLGRCLIAQGWRLALDRFPREIVVPLPPCLSIDALTYLDADGTERALDATAWRVTGLATMEGARIRPASGTGWPKTFDEPECVVVDFTAGFGEAPADVPEPLRIAIAMHAGSLYENRESVYAGSGTPGMMPHGYDDLIRGYRVWGF